MTTTPTRLQTATEAAWRKAAISRPGGQLVTHPSAETQGIVKAALDAADKWDAEHHVYHLDVSSDEVITAMAQALYALSGAAGDGHLWEDASHLVREFYENRAKAVLAAVVGP